MNISFINYPEWQDTADTLHMLLQITGKIKLERCDKRPEWAHARQYLTIDGMTTGIIQGDRSPFEIQVNFRKHHIEVRSAEGKLTLIPLKDGITIADYYQQLMDALAYIGSPSKINVRSQEFYDQVNLDKDTKHHSYDAKAVTMFQDNLLFAYDVLNRFLSPYRGKADFPAYYFGTMDLSCILYSGEYAPMPKKTPISYHAFDESNCEFGFWPGDVRAPKPSFYVMPYPFISDIEGNEKMLRPERAVFMPEKKEFFLTLEDALSYKNPKETIVDFFRSSFEILQRVRRWENIDWITLPLGY